MYYLFKINGSLPLKWSSSYFPVCTLRVKTLWWEMDVWLTAEKRWHLADTFHFFSPFARINSRRSYSALKRHLLPPVTVRTDWQSRETDQHKQVCVLQESYQTCSWRDSVLPYIWPRHSPGKYLWHVFTSDPHHPSLHSSEGWGSFAEAIRQDYYWCVHKVRELFQRILRRPLASFPKDSA